MTLLSEEPPSPRRKWATIAASTFLLLLSYWSIVFAFVAGASDDESVEGGFGPLAFGLALAPFAFMVLAFGSKHRRAPGAVLKAMGLFLLVGVGLVPLVNLIAGLFFAFGAGGIVALRAEEDIHRMGTRVLFLVLAGAYVLILVLAVPAAGLLTGGAAPFLILGIADMVSERRAARADG